MRFKAKHKPFYGIAPVKDDFGKVNGAAVAGNSAQLVAVKIDKGDYYCRDGHDLSMLVHFLKGTWRIYYSGESPIFAACDAGATIRSLHRIAPNLSEFGDESTAEDRAFTCYVVAGKMRDSLERMGAYPTDGLTAAVKRIAPKVLGIRRHKGHDILARDSWLYGGRTEVFREYASVPVKQYDLKSAYAWSYSWPICGEYAERQGDIPDDGSDNFFAEVDIDIPSSCFVPMVPYRSYDGTMVFPSGRWTTWVCGPEALLAAQSGYISKVHQVYRYRESDALQNLALDIFALRGSTPCAVERSLCKVLLVSAYGIFATSGTFPVVLVNPKKIPKDGQQIQPGYYRVWETPKDSPAHVPAAAHIASRVRARLWAAMTNHETGLYYCDTDSIFIGASEELSEETGTGLGQWAPCGDYASGSRWVAPKTYSLGGGAVVKAAGICKENAREYVSGGKVTENKMVGFEQTLTRGYTEHLPVTVSLRTDKVSKRRKIDDFSSAPFDVGHFTEVKS